MGSYLALNYYLWDATTKISMDNGKNVLQKLQRSLHISKRIGCCLNV